MKKIFALICISFNLFFSFTISCAEDIDMSEIECETFFDDKEGAVLLLLWLDGYLSAHSDNTIMSDEWLQKLGNYLLEFCRENPYALIIDSLDSL